MSNRFCLALTVVTLEAGGFKRVVQDGLILRVGDVLPVNSALQIGAVSESVEVKAQSTLLETETSATGTVTEGNQLYKLNMYQRYITNTMSIVPGVTNMTTGGTNGLSAFNVNGQRTSGTAVFEDGVFANDPLASNNLVIKPIMNSVDEVKVLTGCSLSSFCARPIHGSGRIAFTQSVNDGIKPRSTIRFS